MSSYSESEFLMNKVTLAATDTFNRDVKELDKLNPEKLYEIAYMHGFNCGHNIYDAAEEKIEILKVDGDVPVKDFPNSSEIGVEKARESYKYNESDIRYLDNKYLYIKGYQQGFQSAWSKVPNEAMNDQMYAIINYYI